MNETLINGVPAASLPITDRAIHYGDGLFETLALRRGRIEFWEEHMERLSRGCKAMGFPAPDLAVLADEAARLKEGTEEGILKIILSRGSGSRGYRPPEHPIPCRILALYPWPDWPDGYATQGIEARVCTTPLGCNPRLARIKHLNRLEQVLARNEWQDPAIAEGVMLDDGGRLVEGTMSNLFLVQDERLLTPDLSRCGVAGIMRQKVMESAQRLGIDCDVVPLGLRDLENAEAAFFTNSLIGIWPIRRIEGKEFTVPQEMISKIQMDIEHIRSSCSS